MNRCPRNGYLIDATRMLWGDPTELDVDGLPIIGCSRVRCQRCEVRVRSAPGYAFRTPDDVSPAELTTLFTSPDPTISPLLHPTQPGWRVYFCKCSRWLETSEHGCDEPDHDPATDPSVPWGCEGHPQITLPHDINGVLVSSATELRGVVQRALGGTYPPRTLRVDAVRGAWLIRLYVRLQPAERTVVLEEARAALTSPDPRTRGRALYFFVEVADLPARERLIEILQGDRHLYADVPDEITPVSVDKTLEHTIWRVLSPLVAVSGPARVIARADALEGRGSRALYAALAWADSGFIINNLEELARVAPSHVEDLLASLSRLPSGSPVAELRAKLTPPAEARELSLEAALSSTSLEAALALAGPRVGAWDDHSDQDRRLSIYRVGAEGAELLASEELAVDSREDMNERLRASGIRIGGTHRDQRFVWAMDAAGATIWSDTARVFEILPGASMQIVKVVTLFGPEHRGQRGVRTEKADGTSTVVVEEDDPTPSIDPTYGNDEMEADIEWAYYLGQDLAMWLDVPHVDQLSGDVTNANQRVIAEGTRTLATLATQAPGEGAFEPIDHSYGPTLDAGELILRIAPLAGDQRILELRVTPKRSQAALTRPLKLGTNAQIAAFLRQLRTPSTVLRTMNALLR